MFKKFTQTKVGQLENKKENKETGEKKSTAADKLPEIYREEYFGRLEKPKSGLSLVVVAVVLAILSSLTAVFVYEGFFREAVVADKSGQKIIVDKQENITVTSEERLADLSEAAGAAVVAFYQKPSATGNHFFEAEQVLGSGLVLTSDGWLVTTTGLLNKIGESKYVVVTNKNKVYEPKSVVEDPGSNLVFVKIEAKDLPVAKIGEAKTMTSGQLVYGFICNYPKVKLASLHVAEVGAPTVESTEKMTAVLWCREGYDESLLGAPIINMAGEALAVVNSKNEAVPMNYLKSILDGLLKKNKIERSVLGVNYISLAAHPKFNLQDGELIARGAMISGDKNIAAVKKGSPAEKAGLKAGDIIIAVGEDSLAADKTLGELIQSYAPGQKIKISLISGGEEKAVEVVLGKME
ncbi:serine protease [Candidatus Kuenenbacteria bacterium]|nr:serine protease [Candidatus Kuenenbacteria bacterium]